MSNAVITRDDSRLRVSFTEQAIASRDEALASAALIGRVTSESENSECAAAMQALVTVEKETEEARKAIKQPILDYGRTIDNAAKDHLAEIGREKMRLAKMAGDYHQKELAKKRAAEAAEKVELNRIEREREQALAKAETHQEREAIIERANQEAQAARPALVVEKPKGQTVKEVWEVERINEFELASKHPELVRRIEFDMVKVKAALDLFDGKLPGVVARKSVAVSARAETRREAITV